MKKLFLLAISLLVIGSGCGKSSSSSEDNSTAIPSIPSVPNGENYKLGLRAQLENEDLYVVFTNEDALDDSYKERISVTGLNPNIQIIEKSINGGTIYAEPINFRERENELAKISLEEVGGRTVSLNIEKAVEIKGSVAEFNSYSFDSDLKEKFTTTNAILVNQVIANGRTLNIWLEDGLDEKVYNIDILANQFLKTDNNNDIYEYITNVYGKEWFEVGEDSPVGVVAGSGVIDILVYTMNEVEKNPRGTVLGFYNAADNYLKSTSYLTARSNERVMFYLDAYTLKSDKETIISTLAHEFVHMVNFYKKAIGHGESMDVWLNEMLAMIGEDLVANHLQVPGPRGIKDITSAYPTEEEKKGMEGRFYTFNSGTTNTLPINEQGGFGVLNYSQTYAYGAYLIRNMIENQGDLSFIRDIVDNNKGSHDAIEYALGRAGINKTFEETVRDFAKAVVFSDYHFGGNEMYKYNVAKQFNHNGINYKVGPINVHNYVYSGATGLVSFGTNYTSAPRLKYGGVQYFKLGENLNGDYTFELNVPSGVSYEVMVKNADNSYDIEKSRVIQESIVKLN